MSRPALATPIRAPRIKVEDFRIDHNRLSLVQRCAEKIAPECKDLQDWVYSYFKNHSLRFVHDLELLEDYAGKDSKILEFGSIPPILTASIKELGYQVKGVDIAPHRFASVLEEMSLEVLPCNIETDRLPFPQNTFDIALFNELFEHLRINPIFTLREVHRVLRNDGILLLSTPNLRSLSGIFNFLVRNLGYSCSADIYEEYSKLDKFGHMGHVREYTTREVSAFLSSIGFRIECMVYRGSYKNKLASMITHLFPKFRPFVSYVAVAKK